MATIIGHSHRPLAAPPLIKLNIHHLVKKIKGFPLKAKSFRNTEHIKKVKVEVPSTPSPGTTVGI